MQTADQQKRAAAARALEEVQNGMKLGLGTGSTAWHFVDLLGARVKAGLDVLCFPTSEATAAQARSLGIKLADISDHPRIDLVVDGADEIDPALDLIKGGGAAHLREKIIATSADQMFVIADASKLSPILGKFPLPVEVIPFGIGATCQKIADICRRQAPQTQCNLRRTKDSALLKTDSGNYIIDCAMGEIHNKAALAIELLQVPGVVEHGLFLNICTKVFLAHADRVEEIRRSA